MRLRYRNPLDSPKLSVGHTNPGPKSPSPSKENETPGTGDLEVEWNVGSHTALSRPKGPSSWLHAHAQVPSHRSTSVECFRIYVKGMVSSPGWLDDLPEVGRRRGPWRGRRTKGLLDTSTAGENNSLRHGAACQRLCKSRNRATTQPSL